MNALLSRDGIEVNQAQKNGATPLWIACARWFGPCDLNIVKALLAAGADVNKAENGGHTPLHAACERGRLEVVKELLEQPQIDVNPVDKDGDTPLSIAKWYAIDTNNEIRRIRGCADL